MDSNFSLRIYELVGIIDRFLKKKFGFAHSGCLTYFSECMLSMHFVLVHAAFMDTKLAIFFSFSTSSSLFVCLVPFIVVDKT